MLWDIRHTLEQEEALGSVIDFLDFHGGGNAADTPAPESARSLRVLRPKNPKSESNP